MAIRVHPASARTRATALLVAITVAIPAAAAAARTDSQPSATLREQDVPDYPPVAAGDPVIGRIEIPRVGVSAVILEGVDDRTIRRAVGHFPETPLPFQAGNMALAAHRTTDFYGLRNIRPGDDVSVVSNRGTFKYRVERTWVVRPEDVSVLDPSPEKVLTLVTCFPFDYRGAAPERFIVRARSVDPRPGPAPPRPTAALASDDSGFVLLPPMDPKPAT